MLQLGTSKPQTDNKFVIKHTTKLGRNPVIVIGQNPGRQRIGEMTQVVWEGNRSSDFLMQCLDGVTNTLLTNVCNFQVMTHENVMEGINDLVALIQEFTPRKLVCLGNFAHSTVIKLMKEGRIQPMTVVKFEHPSYIVRFNKDKDNYKFDLRKEIVL